MPAISKRFTYLFISTRGLALVAIAAISLITAIWGTLSGPMVEWGVRDITVKFLGMDLVQAEREGRIILLYHTIAMAVVAVEVFFITDSLPMKRHQQVTINATITVGYLTSLIRRNPLKAWAWSIRNSLLSEMRPTRKSTSRNATTFSDLTALYSMMPRPALTIPTAGMACPQGLVKDWRFQA